MGSSRLDEPRHRSRSRIMTDHEILSLFTAGHGAVALEGCRGSYLALVLARLAGAGAGVRPVFVLTATEEGARELARDLAFFLGREGAGDGGAGRGGEAKGDAGAGRANETPMDLPRVMHLPEVETSPYADISPDRAATMARQGVLFRLSQGYEGEILVASAAATRRRVIPRADFAGLCELVGVEEEIGRDPLAARLVACGFGRVQVVEDAGTFSVRGGIVDVFPPLYRFPVRVEFYGDFVESLRLFDPRTQRTLRGVEELFVHPVRETVRTGGVDLRAAILRAADESNHPSSKTRALLEELEGGAEFFGIEALTPAFHAGMSSPIEYLPGEGLVVVVDRAEVEEALTREEARSEEAYRSRLAQGRLAFAPSAFFAPLEELAPSLAPRPGRRLLEVGLAPPPAAGAEDAAGEGGATVRCAVRDNAELAAELRRAHTEKGEEVLGPLTSRLRSWLEEGRRVLVAAGSVSQAERLEALLGAHGLPALVEKESGTPDLLAPSTPAGFFAPSGAAALRLHAGVLGAGFAVGEGPGALVVLSEEEIFGPKTRRAPARRAAGKGLGDLSEIAEGDFVVHAQHGIGRYRGLSKLEILGVPADFLLLDFAGGDRLYLPVYRMNLVQRYTEGGALEPKLDRLGGATWQKKKGRVRLEVRKLAEELLQLYAQRAALEGRAVPPPDGLFTEFEATFPFSETPDQERAVAEVLADLTAPRPMDRLICGDVGFGKTEVALRAAFLVVQGGRQVALLAPTTVLVEQHHRTFAERMGPYALRVESVSRFRDRADLARVLADLAQGKVDVVIGTHRLLSPDVRIKDLGLLIVDEEQRFGVAHKERLRRLRTQVDLLTLTATPIPRTLQMSMIGLREISIISTPPVDRLAIRTFVCRYDDALVAEAIRKELARGGQVFFVHNRIESIDEWAARLAAVVPEARIAVAHGQMEAARLEKVMVDFVAGRHDLLVCTAIIESGLDIPRANTMFVNRADMFGLAQLYQLRGRIGRSKHRAFCYLLVPELRSMSPEARQRLSTLERFTELGSGFSVASHDLEIRGAGELLGAKQSGHIAALGFDAYARILEEAVSELRGEPITRETDPEINSCVPAYIPDDYVEDAGQRLDLYRRLSQAASDEDAVRDLLDEIKDRYGPPPDLVAALGELMIVKGLAIELRAVVIDLSGTRLSLTLDSQTPLGGERVVQLVSDRALGYRLTPEGRLLRALDPGEQASPLEATKKILRDLLAYAKGEKSLRRTSIRR
jgi:transcription-repair coupling factor (superfamily II helicase)